MHALTQTDHMALAQLSQSRALPIVSRWAVQVAYLCLVWSQRSRTRCQLKGLEPRMLRDIGITEGESHAEFLKWFWRP